MITGSDVILELDGGGPMGFLLYGDDIDLDEIEVFLSTEVEEWWYDEGPEDGFDVLAECYVRKVPITSGEDEGSMRYVYANTPGPGARKCTRVEAYSSWGYWCMNHIFEPASTGIPVERVADPIWPMVLARITSAEERARHPDWTRPRDGNATVYLCSDCARAFHAREDRARWEHMRAFHTERGEHEAAARYEERLRAA